MGHSERETRRDALQGRICGEQPALPENLRKFEHEVREFLIEAADERILVGGQAAVRKLLRRVRTEDKNAPREAMSLFGGEKNIKRDPAKAHFQRKDGAWFDFVFTVLETKAGLTLLAYDAEIRFPAKPAIEMKEGNEHRLPPYIRYDLNFETIKGGAAHDNAERGLRSHCHPGHDALQAPSPLFHPIDLLDLLVYRLSWY